MGKIRPKKEKDPLEFKPLIPLSIAAGLLILAAIFFFVTPIGKTFTKKAIQRVTTTIEVPVEDSAPSKPRDAVPVLAPRRIEESASVVDRILDSLDRVIASGMGLIGLIVAIKQLQKSQTVKKARAARTSG